MLPRCDWQRVLRRLLRRTWRVARLLRRNSRVLKPLLRCQLWLPHAEWLPYAERQGSAADGGTTVECVLCPCGPRQRGAHAQIHPGPRARCAPRLGMPKGANPGEWQKRLRLACDLVACSSPPVGARLPHDRTARIKRRFSAIARDASPSKRSIRAPHQPAANRADRCTCSAFQCSNCRQQRWLAGWRR